MGGQNQNQWVQRGIGGAQIAGGAVASYFGAPEIGIPLMMNGIKSEVNPSATQSPLQSGIGGALSTGGSIAGGYGGGAAGGAGASGIDPSSMGDMLGSINPGAFDSSTLGGGSSSAMSGMGNFNPAMLSQLMGGGAQAMQQPKPLTPQPQMQAPKPPPMPPATNLQSIGQQAATPQVMPAPKVPSPPQAPQQQNPLIQKLMQLLGGSM